MISRYNKISPHFKKDELATKTRFGYPRTQIPDKYIPKYKDTLEFCERLRLFMNMWLFMKGGKWLEIGIKVVSGYRHRPYNRKVGSSDTSMHTDPNPKSKNLAPCAMDVMPVGGYKHLRYVTFYLMCLAVAASFPDRPYRIGKYSRDLFVHIDCGYGYGSTRWGS